MLTGKSDISGWLVRPASGRLWAGLVTVLGASAVHTVRMTSDAVVPVVAVTGVLGAAWVCALRLYGVPLASSLAALGPAGLAALVAVLASSGHPVRWDGGPVTAAVALPLCLLLACRGRWVAAGALTGAAVALQPLLAPMALLFVFAHRWRALGALVLVSAPASVSAALLLPERAGLVAGMPRAPAEGVALVAAAIGVLCAHRRWDAGDRGPSRLVETSTGLMLSAFLVSRPSYGQYLLIMLPLLLAGLPYAGSVARRPWLTLVPQLPGMTLPWPVTRRRRASRAFTFCVLTVTVVCRRVRAERRDGRCRVPGR